MAFDEKTIQELNNPLTAHKLDGKGYTYMKVSEVIDKLNKAFSYSWSSKLLKVEKLDNFIIAQVEISVIDSSGNVVVKQGTGGTEVKMYSKGPKAGSIVDLSNDYASAVASALKNSAKQFGLKVSDVGTSSRPAAQRPPVQGNFTKQNTTTKPAQKSVGGSLVEQTLRNTGPAGPKSSSTVIQTKASEASPFPAGGAKKTLTPVQLKAVMNLSEKTKKSVSDVLGAAVPGTNKTRLEDLTIEEAAACIKYLNTQMRQDARG